MLKMLKKLISCFLIMGLLLCFSGAALAQYKIVISTSANKLYLYQDGSLTKTYSVATGKSSFPTPKGTFSIIVKTINPPYYKTNIAGGDPNNPLGPRWLGIDYGGGNEYGIHGTNDPSSIGTNASAGCVRMNNSEVIGLYDIIPYGTQVVIQEAAVTETVSTPAPAPTPAVQEVKIDFPENMPQKLQQNIKDGLIVPQELCQSY